MEVVGARTVSAVAVLDLAQELMMRQLLQKEELAGVSLALAEYDSAATEPGDLVETRMPEADLVALWQLAEQRQPQSALGVDIGRRVNPEAKGILAHWISCCDTLGEVFDVFQNNVRLLNSAECWQLEQADGKIVLSFELVSDFAYPQMALERSMVAFLAWGEYFCGKNIPLMAAEFTFSQPTYREKYDQAFNCDLTFDQARNRLVLDASIFQWRVIGANGYLRSVLQDRSQAVDTSVERERSCSQRVQRLLKQDLARFSHQTSVCAALHMSRASLYRKLKSEGLQFSELLQQERHIQLSRLRSEQADPESSALALGFSDVSSFYRFLKRL